MWSGMSTSCNKFKHSILGGINTDFLQTILMSQICHLFYATMEYNISESALASQGLFTIDTTQPFTYHLHQPYILVFISTMILSSTIDLANRYKNGHPKVQITTDNRPGVEKITQPGEPDGPPQEMSNVNYAEEAVNMIEAEVGVKANVKALQTQAETVSYLIDIFA